MIKYFIITVGLIFSLQSMAGSFDVFMDSLRQEYFINKTTRGKELRYHVRVTPFNWIMRRLNPDAIATYNDKLNVISLNEKLLNKSGGRSSIKSIRAIESNGHASDKVSTIFHEMGHAELDVFIENGKQESDQTLNAHYKFIMRDFYRRYFPGFNPKALFHEHFGYYRGELIETMANEIENVLLQNGFNRYKNTCFATPKLKSLVAKGIALEEFKQFFSFGEIKSYSSMIGPAYIFIKGKDIHLKARNIPQSHIRNTELMFWQYHQTQFDFPSNEKELVKRMNLRSRHRVKLAQCREKLWNDLQIEFSR